MIDMTGNIKNDRFMKFYDADIHGSIPHPLWKTKVIFRTPMTGESIQLYADALEETAFAVAVLLHNNASTDGDAWALPGQTALDEKTAMDRVANAGDWELSFTSFGEPDKHAVMIALESAGNDVDDIHSEKLPETDWLQHVHRDFPPVTIGEFFVYGSHYDGDLPADKMTLQIDAATAFGSGEHETTQACLMALQELRVSHDFINVLDMGCGSGILAIAARKLWPQATVTAVDIDPESVTVTKRHAAINHTPDIMTEAGDGYHSPIVAKNGPFDLIIANILAGPVMEMAPDLSSYLKPGGSAVVSGLLSRHEDPVAAAHADAGLKKTGAIPVNDWRAILFQKDA